ncbi:PAS domain-containing sensor histidine kinase [Flavihumibacter petaseus]|uniref:histidine kinase n=1 Tax=Flavihumibacter petaseus NBRC 106054 TaxID=1220578 RepID=A0A0E9N745_9BACT|nr:PAS domain-containing sensor histidine kinase [Flavihumibacter petaseus]GAO45170.1 putative two-component histidine kinase [Flavihumibacter petaseus NBRC 106054]
MRQEADSNEALFRHASMGIVVVNSRGAIIRANPFAEKLFGYAADELAGKPIEILIPSRYAARHIGHREAYVENPKSRPMGVGMDLYAVTKDGREFPVEVSLGNFSHDDEQQVIAFISDITVRKRAEAEIEKLNNDLEETVEQRTRVLKDTLQQLELSLEKEKELNELKSRFVTMASHEFRTPLSTVQSSAYLIGKYTSTDDQPKREKHLQRIYSSITMLTDILNDFLSVGKIEEGKILVRKTTFRIAHFVQEVLAEMGNNLKPGQQIQFEHSGAEEEVWLDPSLLKHIMLNLLSNASKFSPPGSIISVTSQMGTDGLEIAVQDRGMGISAEDQQHLMERFFRGANALNIQGTGLGLHIISKYVELMDGEIACESVLEEGTTFFIRFDKVKHYEAEKNITH